MRLCFLYTVCLFICLPVCLSVYSWGEVAVPKNKSTKDYWLFWPSDLIWRPRFCSSLFEVKHSCQIHRQITDRQIDRSLTRPNAHGFSATYCQPNVPGHGLDLNLNMDMDGWTRNIYNGTAFQNCTLTHCCLGKTIAILQTFFWKYAFLW